MSYISVAILVLRPLIFTMKSRLLPPPTVENREFENGSPSTDYVRRVADAAQLETGSSSVQPTPAPVTDRVTSTPRSAPPVSARPKGRLIVASVLLACVGSLTFCLWSTFLRDAAYGVVAGNVTNVSTPWSGTIMAIYVRPGDTVRQGDILAVVDDPELQAMIDRISDDLRGAQAELDAQVALLAIASRERGNTTEETRADYYNLRGELVAEQARHEELTSKLRRRQELADRHAYSSEEIESLRFVKHGLSAKIAHLQQAVGALETRLATLPVKDHNATQLKPQLARIENYQAEIRRLHNKQRRGTVRAPMDSTVIDVRCQVGERATTEQPLLELLPIGDLEVVLYIQQKAIAAYRIGQLAKVVVDPASEPITCRVTRIGQRFEKPHSHVVGRYRPEEKLLPVYLAPTSDLSPVLPLRIGSAVRLPATLFGLEP